MSASRAAGSYVCVCVCFLLRIADDYTLRAGAASRLGVETVVRRVEPLAEVVMTLDGCALAGIVRCFSFDFASQMDING